MPIDTRFSIALAIMAVVAFGCRVAGLIVGTHLGDNPGLRRFLDILPACAMGAVLGPSLAVMTLVQAIAILVSCAVFLASTRFLLALALGTAVLLSERWIMAVMV
ncbi:MAG: AzlD domain-containing protein [Hyphomicrobiaceae bacterium]|nr:AzlD domain-containing protein [Hyphomicrobiaceae bacterium]